MAWCRFIMIKVSKVGWNVLIDTWGRDINKSIPLLPDGRCTNSGCIQGMQDMWASSVRSWQHISFKRLDDVAIWVFLDVEVISESRPHLVVYRLLNTPIMRWGQRRLSPKICVKESSAQPACIALALDGAGMRDDRKRVRNEIWEE